MKFRQIFCIFDRFWRHFQVEIDEIKEIHWNFQDFADFQRILTHFQVKIDEIQTNVWKVEDKEEEEEEEEAEPSSCFGVAVAS